MSRAYRITLSESLSRVVHLGDAVESSLDLLPILASERMFELLGQALAERGFAVEGRRAARTWPDGVEVVVDLVAGTVAVALSEQVAVAVEGTATGASDVDVRKRAKDEAEVKAQAMEAEARRALTARLESRLGELRKDLDRAINDATGRALEEKARQMGEIEELKRDPATGSVTIRIRL
jgi:hypothetical protein